MPWETNRSLCSDLNFTSCVMFASVEDCLEEVLSFVAGCKHSPS